MMSGALETPASEMVHERTQPRLPEKWSKQVLGTIVTARMRESASAEGKTE